jgi:hypothetical protein
MCRIIICKIIDDDDAPLYLFISRCGVFAGGYCNNTVE